jgi:hypothetical protein
MATPQLSPGILVREVDLTVGRAENVLDNIGAIAGPFKKGPVNEPTDITTEQQLLDVFGSPTSRDNQYEYWMSASSYLSYGGILKVVRTDGAELKNSNVSVGGSSIDVKIKNFDDYLTNYSTTSSSFYFAAKDPGFWANNLKVCIIDDLADQIIGIGTTNPENLGFQVGYGVTVDISGNVIPGTGTTAVFNGYLKGIVTNITPKSLASNKSDIAVKIISRVSAAGTEYPIDYAENNQFASFLVGNRINSINNIGNLVSPQDSVGSVGVTTFSVIDGEQGEVYTGVAGTSSGSASGATFNITRNNTNGGVQSAVVVNSGLGYTVGATITIPGTSVGGYSLTNGAINQITVGAATTLLAQANTTYSSVSGVSTLGTGALFTVFRDGVGGISTVSITNPGGSYGVGTTVSIAGTSIGGSTPANNLILTVSTLRDDKIILTVTESQARVEVIDAVDWYGEQTLGLDNSIVYWKSIAPKPTTNNYVAERNGRNDGLHVVLVDDSGDVTGIQGSILEKHVNLSKAADTISSVNSPQKIWYKNYLANYSKYIYAGSNPSQSIDNYHRTTPTSTGFSTSFSVYSTAAGLWDENAQDVVFSSVGPVCYNLTNGVDYSVTGGFKASLGDIQSSYRLFDNRDEIAVDYLINGPGLDDIADSQAKANNLIAIAEARKDCVAVISPHRGSVVDITNSNTQTENIIEFFSALTSSSYAVFDSGYKYTYDRFNNLFRYIPCNADIAGLMCRTNIVAYPWFSPAGQQRGNILNAIKLSYNPNKAQRDRLYPARVNSIINQPGGGIILFGDKTALAYQSAFDRINVRRLFLTIEQALEKAAQSQLFEFNDQLTRANFVNIVEPYLRDVQAKRGVYDYLVVCDETNNTPDVIDNNEFRADIYLKPAKSINYITLTFVATRTGVSFEEVAGRV